MKSRIHSKREGVKEFELFGEQKIAKLSQVKLEKMRRYQIRVEVIDELTNTILARNNLKMGKLIRYSDFMNLLLTIEPIQHLSLKMMISM